MAKQLKIWNGRSPKHNGGTVYVAAYSIKQAGEITEKALGLWKGAVSYSEITKYWHNGAWGNSMDGVTPTEPCVYLQEGYNKTPNKIYPNN